MEVLRGFGWHWLHGVQLETTRYLIGAIGVAAFTWAAGRWIVHRRIQNRRASFADRRREAMQSIQTIMVFSFVNLLAFVMIGLGWIRFAAPPMNLPVMVAQVVAMVLLHDVYFYWMHRWLHTRAMFRRAHATHHLSRTPTSFAAYAFAPIEAVTESIYVPVMILVVSAVSPLYPFGVFIFLGHQIARNAIGHSGFELAWPGFTRSRLTGWMTTTTHHDLHHTEGRYNFGLYFTWWDRMMGTEHPRYHEKFEAVVTQNTPRIAQAEGR